MSPTPSNYYSVQVTKVNPYHLDILTIQLESELQLPPKELREGLEHPPYLLPIEFDSLAQVRQICRKIKNHGCKVAVEQHYDFDSLDIDSDTEGDGSEPSPSPWPDRLWRWMRWLIAALIIVAVGVGSWLLLPDDPQEDSTAQPQSSPRAPPQPPPFLSQSDTDLSLSELFTRIDEQQLSITERQNYSEHYQHQAEESMQQMVGFLTFAIAFNPNNYRAWKKLHHTYLTMGMSVKADEIVSRFPVVPE